MRFWIGWGLYWLAWIASCWLFVDVLGVQGRWLMFWGAVTYAFLDLVIKVARFALTPRRMP